MKKTAAVAVVAFVITLTAIVGTRMNAEAIAVIVGVLCGMAAGIPASLLIAVVTNRRAQTRQSTRPHADYPPVVVVTPGQASPSYPQLPYLPSMTSPQNGTRTFRVVGDAELADPSPVRRW